MRGHQVRKNYKKLVWSVGIMEKVILRWRRKRPGLRGFRVEKTIEDESSENKRSDDYEFLSVGRKQKFAGVEKALARVQSMSRHPEAREQYMRLQSKFEKLKVILHSTSIYQKKETCICFFEHNNHEFLPCWVNILIEKWVFMQQLLISDDDLKC